MKRRDCCGLDGARPTARLGKRDPILPRRKIDVLGAVPRCYLGGDPTVYYEGVAISEGGKNADYVERVRSCSCGCSVCHGLWATAATAEVHDMQPTGGVYEAAMRQHLSPRTISKHDRAKPHQLHGNGNLAKKLIAGGTIGKPITNLRRE